MALVDRDTQTTAKAVVYLTSGTVIVVGVVAMVIGTTEGVHNMIDYFKDG